MAHDTQAAMRQAQFAYVAYRTLDCFPVLLYGGGQRPDRMDSGAKAVARLLRLLLAHSEQLPQPHEVHLSTEALVSQLFYFAVTQREHYVELLRLAYDLVFRALDIGPRAAAMKTAFERVLDELSLSQAPLLGLHTREELQVRELAQLVLRSLSAEPGQTFARPAL